MLLLRVFDNNFFTLFTSPCLASQPLTEVFFIHAKFRVIFAKHSALYPVVYKTHTFTKRTEA